MNPEVVEQERLGEPLVSVIVVSWNARRYLRQCLASLTPAASRYPLEIIVVDNASTDGSPEAVEQEFPRVQLLRNAANLGFAKANNLGIAASRGRYVCLVNSDVKVLPNCITRLVDYCQAHPEAGMVGPRVLGGDGKQQRSCRGFPSLWNMFCRALALDSILPRCRAFTGYSLSHWAQDSLRPVDMLSGCFWLVARPALSRVGLLDEDFFMYAEDMDWCRRFWNAGFPVVFVPQAEAVHYGGASSANAPVRFYIERQRADLRYWRKHHSRVAVGCFWVISCVHLLLRAVGYRLALWLKPDAARSYDYKCNRSLACLQQMLTGAFTRAPSPGSGDTEVGTSKPKNVGVCGQNNEMGSVRNSAGGVG